MEGLVRKDSGFSLCGLNCCLCPRFNAEGKSRCPGCGGPGFAEKHPTCAVATCNRKHDNAEYCFQCSAYPCARYEKESQCDSFISYRSVKENFGAAKADLDGYRRSLERRSTILRALLASCNDGRSKGLYCLVANDMPLAELERLLELSEGLPPGMDVKEKARALGAEIGEIAARLGAEYRLRRK
jgi:hypothetical protein